MINRFMPKGNLWQLAGFNISYWQPYTFVWNFINFLKFILFPVSLFVAYSSVIIIHFFNMSNVSNLGAMKFFLVHSHYISFVSFKTNCVVSKESLVNVADFCLAKVCFVYRLSFRKMSSTNAFYDKSSHLQPLWNLSICAAQD